jgi:hypothetical protein
MPAAQTAQLAALGQVRSGDQVAHSWPLALTQLLIVRRLADAGI